MKKDRPRHLLIAEDDANFGMMLKFFLEMNGFAVTLCPDGESAVRAFRQAEYDLCILDVMMPFVDGFTVAETIAASRRDIPFVFLTAKGMKDDQVRGYKLGALDYLVKPFDPEILLLKIAALLRQPGNAPAPAGRFRIGSFEFDYEMRILQSAEEQVKLSPKESDLLRLLCERQDDYLAHEEALIKIWKNDDYFTKQSMNVFITRLRKYLSADPEYVIEIENLHGKGFVLKARAREDGARQ